MRSALRHCILDLALLCNHDLNFVSNTACVCVFAALPCVLRSTPSPKDCHQDGWYNFHRDAPRGSEGWQSTWIFLHFSQTVWPHLVVSYVRAVVADPYSTKAPLSTEVSRETWSWDVWTAKFGDLYSTKAPYLPFLTEVSHEMVVRTSRSTLSSLWACRIALAVARCEFWDRSRNLLVALRGSDRSRVARCSFRDRSSNRLVTFDVSDRVALRVKEILRRDLEEVFCRELAQRSCRGDLL